MSKLLALDQSSHITGYAIYEDGKLIQVGHFECKCAEIGERLVEFRKSIIYFIEKYKINEVAFEDIQLQNNVVQNVKTFKMLSEIFGVLQELLEELKIPYTIVPPNVWKSSFKIAGKGRAVEKKMAKDYILNTYGIKCTEDEADAACLGAHIIANSIEEFDWSN